MRIQLDMPEDTVRRLQAEANHRGVNLTELIVDLASGLPREGSGAGRRPAFVGIGASQGGCLGRVDERLAEGFGRD